MNVYSFQSAEACCTAESETRRQWQHSFYPERVQFLRCGGLLYGTHRSNENPIVMDPSGKVWRFAAPQNVKPNPAKNQPGVVHLLVPGAVIKTAKPKLVVLSPGNEANVSA